VLSIITALAANSKIVLEIKDRGGLLYLLDLFANSTIPEVCTVIAWRQASCIWPQHGKESPVQGSIRFDFDFGFEIRYDTIRSIQCLILVSYVLVRVLCYAPNKLVRFLSDVQIRTQAAMLFARLGKDKLYGPKVNLSVVKFLPRIFMDAWKESPEYVCVACYCIMREGEGDDRVWRGGATLITLS
jgi:hypothetical protein